jgi:hypothetical protein
MSTRKPRKPRKRKLKINWPWPLVNNFARWAKSHPDEVNRCILEYVAPEGNHAEDEEGIAYGVAYLARVTNVMIEEFEQDSRHHNIGRLGPCFSADNPIEVAKEIAWVTLFGAETLVKQREAYRRAPQVAGTAVEDCWRIVQKHYGIQLATAGSAEVEDPCVLEELRKKYDALPPSRKKAWMQYFKAECKRPGCTDREAYEMTCAALQKDGLGEQLPSFKTWTKYLRDVRALLKMQKYSSVRPVPTGHSVVSKKDIE